jgi:hypothetical protein
MKRNILKKNSKENSNLLSDKFSKVITDILYESSRVPSLQKPQVCHLRGSPTKGVFRREEGVLDFNEVRRCGKG